MISEGEAFLVGTCLEGFFYGLYSGIFVMYVLCKPERSRTATIIFYALCLLYVLSTATVVTDLLSLILESRINTLQLQIDSQPMLFRLSVVQATVSGCCDFIAQCIIIYRCWIVWGRNIGVVIIPSFLLIVYLATWPATITLVPTQFTNATWDTPVVLANFAASMAVNALVTSLIVFKILKLYFEVRATSVEPTLSSADVAKLRYIIFAIIESGMALFAIQLVRVVLVNLPVQSAPYFVDLVLGTHEMINGIAPTIIFVRVSRTLYSDNEESFREAIESLRFSDTPSEFESSEDVCFNKHPSDP